MHIACYATNSATLNALVILHADGVEAAASSILQANEFATLVKECFQPETVQAVRIARGDCSNFDCDIHTTPSPRKRESI